MGFYVSFFLIILAPSFSISEINNLAGKFFEIFPIAFSSFSLTIVKTVCPNRAVLAEKPFCIKISIKLLQYVFAYPKDVENWYDRSKKSEIFFVFRTFIIILLQSWFDIFLMLSIKYRVKMGEKQKIAIL